MIPKLISDPGKEKSLSYFWKSGKRYCLSREQDGGGKFSIFPHYKNTAGSELRANVVSGGARGVDREAKFTALDEGGNVVGVLPDGLAKAAVSKKYRKALKSRNLVLFSATDPGAGFSVGNAMGRNTYIYAMSDYCLIPI